MPIILLIFAAFTNSNFNIMRLDNFLKLTISDLKFLEVACSNQMKLSEDFISHIDDSDVMMDYYNSIGFVLASIRDILKEFEKDA